ncbi:hypothetical protein E2R51_13835 [Jeotgalibacillus sp. S-D1]|uniref:hypothetical protein n=1 Tax=Jeotgalibacillus sp. S-D1 TaxID=2552189 RepID=UPI0010599110|nr:hypothetical protein [Jeotgalibacillus sp. S-D1]TDL31441.1 hypothetical protein E2R51_13835 [Jeotgalibacillus sp. S-D1]
MTLSKEQQRSEAIELFNKTWELVDLQVRTGEQEEEMIHLAHASRYYWSKAGDYVNWSRGDWLLSKVYSIVGEGQNALKYALANEKLHTEYNLADFDAAFVHEALARSYAVLEKQDLKEFHLGKARGLVEGISKKEDREYFVGELEKISDI